MPRADRYVPIADYALIGDCHGVALVRRDGSIDWACLDRFDSGGVFSRMLDAERGGAFELAPREPFEVSRQYLVDTNILETTFTTASGTARVVDCFAMHTGGATRPLRQLLRTVEGIDGEVVFDARITPRFDYASLHPWIRHHPEHGLYSATGGNDAIVVWSDHLLAMDEGEAFFRAEIIVGPRERARFSLTAVNPHRLDLAPQTPRSFDARGRETHRWWRRWSSTTRAAGITDPAVIRSALVLKLLTCGPTGAMVAAATTSLPEVVGGTRNWDYRYTWIRDATMTLGALIATGHVAVANGFKRFIEAATAGRPDELQIMYGCYGERRLPELTIESLEGYRGSAPVRIGNGAARQTQLDVYGELLDAAHLWTAAGSTVEPDGWVFLRGLVDTACRRWEEPDHGLWEMRGKPQHFVYSKAMCWLAVSRGIELAEALDLECELASWKKVRAKIRASIETHGVDRARGCYVQAFGSKELDASLLRLPLIGFIGATHPRMRATIKAIEEDLTVGPLVRRYRTEHADDGQQGEEGAFLLASFWLVDVLAMAKRRDQATKLYAKLLSLANDVGLFAEQYDPDKGEMLGNFPQAFTHIALINASAQLKRGGGATSRAVTDRVAKDVRLGVTGHHGAAPAARRRSSRRK
ncbi:MAG: glycoside hydrolase family 15 protein [Polyangia bacterium]